jgi:hypothetical protein
MLDSLVPATVDAAVREGTVTLGSPVDGQYQHEEAERVAGNVPGVIDVEDEVYLDTFHTRRRRRGAQHQEGVRPPRRARLAPEAAFELGFRRDVAAVARLAPSCTPVAMQAGIAFVVELRRGGSGAGWGRPLLGSGPRSALLIPHGSPRRSASA